MGFLDDLGGALTGRTAAGAAKRAGRIQEAGTRAGIEELRSALGPIAGTLEQTLPALLGFTLDPSQQAQYVLNNPLLQPLQEQVTRDVLQRQAAGGKSLSGGTLEELQNRLIPIGLGLAGQRQNQLMNLAQFGAGGAQTMGLGISDLLGSGAAARAASTVGAANAQQQGIMNLLSLGTTAALMAGGGGAAAPAMTGGGFTNPGAFGNPGSLSDERTKENITHISTLDDGINVYTYNYIGDDTMHTGVIAQEIEEIYPDAVVTRDGIKYVDYEKLGVNPEMLEALTDAN